jgi:hypothetical protein
MRQGEGSSCWRAVDSGGGAGEKSSMAGECRELREGALGECKGGWDAEAEDMP